MLRQASKCSWQANTSSDSLRAAQEIQSIQTTDSSTSAAINPFSHFPFSSAILCNGYSPSEQAHQIRNYSIPIYLAQPTSTPDAQPISRAYADFLGYARQEILKGTSPNDILGSSDFDVEMALGNPKTRNTSLVSEWACNIVSAYGKLPLAVQLGAIHMSFRLMRASTNGEEKGATCRNTC